MRHEHLIADDLARPVLQEIADGDEIAEALRHLRALDLKMPIMDPDIGHDLRAVSAGRLRHLVLMVREDEVDAAAMDVEDLAEKRGRHGRALKMPAWPAEAPGAVPARLVAAA